MSEWIKAEKEDIEINLNDRMIDIYVKNDDNGTIYVELPIDIIKEILREYDDEGEK